MLRLLIALFFVYSSSSFHVTRPWRRARTSVTTYLSSSEQPLETAPEAKQQQKKGKEKGDKGSTAPSKSLDELVALAQEYEDDGLKCLSNAGSTKEVETLRVLFLGKNGKITGMMNEMRLLPKADKPKLGEVVNRAKEKLELEVEERKKALFKIEIEAKIQRESLGNLFQIKATPQFYYAQGSRHPLSLTLQLATSIFEEIGYEAVMGPEDSPEIENDFFNFQALGMPPDHPARNMQDTFYINSTKLDTNDTLLLRTHTSAVQIREMEKRKPPFKIVCPGRVYRKDDVDATHYPVFHQCEILAVDEIGKLTLPHLLGTVKYFLQKMFGKDIEVKYRASYFPFTEPSVEVDVYFKGRWLEVLGCGMVDPVVLEAVGLDPTKYAGFAAGFGIERFAMIMHNITDIRLFWENRLDWLRQFPSRPYAIPGDDDEAMAADEFSLGFDDYPGWNDQDPDDE
jgi:phenylalanyl-tRNA synthetase alpha chain